MSADRVGVDVDVESAVVRYRDESGDDQRSARWQDVDVDGLIAAAPWRQFPQYPGQRHYPGMYWFATQQALVVYESRLELAVLLAADYDRAVTRATGQPFMLAATVEGVVRRHVPDFLLMTDTGPVVVDVKPADRRDDPRTARTLAWTNMVVQQRGWRYEVTSGPAPVELANLRFLAGYRRVGLFDQQLTDRVRAITRSGMTLAEVLAAAPGPAHLARSALLHLLWRQDIRVDLSVLLQPRTPVVV
ncbi:TnsA-like heteromeric transposase endonuclease subunit [Mycobacteroides abscessus]|uniref:TnsA-like heteromeric transposase endonuclease subunit n=1 Tax=Mycobacteroides abscessus TaxID=36809 RepID=UPI001F3CB431|nr:TnsA-like heteromeric transposase endonuclease subunit [Mycobacteroides abscessus]